MRSFSESLQARRNIDLATSLFVEMHNVGLDPRRFVHWLVEEGIEFEKAQFTEQCQEWLVNEGERWNRFKSAVGGAATGAANWVKNNVNYQNIADVGHAIGQGAGHLAGASVGAPLAAAGGMVRGFAPTAAGHVASGAAAGLGLDQSGQPAAGGAGAGAGGAGAGAGGAGGRGGQQANNLPPEVSQAVNILQHYSKDTAGRVQKLLGDPNFGSAITQLIGSLNQMSAQPEQPGAVIGNGHEGGAVVPPAAASGAPANAWHQPHGQLVRERNFTNYLTTKALARNVVTEFSRRGIDPMLFVEWYAEEGHLLKGRQFDEGLWDRFTGWLGNVTGWTKAQNQRDLQATQYLMQFLQGFQQKPSAQNPEVKQQLDSVLQGLQRAQEFLGGPAAASAPWRR